MNSAWGYLTSLLNVEISLKCVTTSHLPSAPLQIIIREALALKNTLLTRVASGIEPELTPLWTCSLPLVRTWTNQTGMSKALSDKPSHPNNFAILYCPVLGVCFSRKLPDARPLQGSLRLCLHAVPTCLERNREQLGPSFHLFNSLTF